MDKDKCSDIHGQSSWMDMHQFIGDFITSANPSKNQHDVLNASWGLAAAAAAAVGGGGGGGTSLGFKAASFEALQLPRPAQEKTDAEPSRRIQPGAPQRKGGTRERREDVDVHQACTCPGCPFSGSPLSFETLTPRQQSLLPHSEAVRHPKDVSSAAPRSLNKCLADTTASELETRLSSQPQTEDADRATQNQDQSSDAVPSRASLSQLSMFPCVCCHRGLQTCTHVLSQQEGRDFPHTHAHHHFHHHHCPLTSCLPCPQLAHLQSPQLSGPFPCLSCSLPTCAQVCQHQHRSTQPQEERARTATTLLPLHPCMHCTASFSRPSQLLQHQRSEHAHKPPGFLCTDCGRTFNSHSNLRIHQNVHTGARPYTCSECGKSFSQSGALKIHRRIHTGERPYSCGFCGRGFPHLAGVRAHQRTHTGEKPYRCNQCGKCFTQSGALKIHTRIHTGERPFTCSLCGKGFSNRSGIRFHYRTVHGLAPEHTGEAGTDRSCPPGRPRTLPSNSVRQNIPNSPDSNLHAASGSLSSSELSAAHSHGPALLEGKTDGGRHREGLLYACEDCGLRFKDAPSRNRHQTVAHYSNEQRDEEEDEEEEEEGQRKEFNTDERVREN